MSYPQRASQLSTSDRVISAVKNNPEGLLLLAAGCALLLRSRSSSSTPGGAQTASTDWRQDGLDYGMPSAGSPSQPQSSSSGAAYRAKEMASGAVERAQETARSAVDSATGFAQDVTRQASAYADDAQRRISGYAQRVSADTQSTFRNTVDYLVRERPLAIALAGLAAGAAVATVFRPTDIEKNALSPLGAKMRHALDETSGRVAETAERAGERLKEATRDPSKLKDSVSGIIDDVSETFGGSEDRPSERGTGQTQGRETVSQFPGSGYGKDQGNPAHERTTPFPARSDRGMT